MKKKMKFEMSMHFRLSAVTQPHFLLKTVLNSSAGLQHWYTLKHFSDNNEERGSSFIDRLRYGTDIVLLKENILSNKLVSED